MATSICWFRRDLRLADNPAWAAATHADAVLPVYVLEPDLLRAAGARRRTVLLASVDALAAEIADAGGRLHVVEGPAHVALARLVDTVDADVVHANADVTPFAAARDTRVSDAGIPVTWWWGTLVQPPGAVLTAKGELSKVFTPFHRRWEQTALPDSPESADAAFVDLGGGVPLAGVGHDPRAELPMAAGSAAAAARLAAFAERVDDYPELHDDPAADGTSHLSTDLRFGTLSPAHVIDVLGTHTAGRRAAVRQLAWRDWYAHHLHGTPGAVDAAIRPRYDRIRWRDAPEDLARWQQGRTGFPLVDAGMRQLSATGWMHNRVRMVVASFLVKDLLIDWRLGERWFRHHLTDGDVAQNVGNWQWAAGTGHDAAPYFRIFNPVSQSRTHDPDGTYIRRWVPELADVSAADIHEPWSAAPLDLAAAGVTLGDTYPTPIVDHADARQRALRAYEAAVGSPDPTDREHQDRRP